jgi:hypothetical protein
MKKSLIILIFLFLFSCSKKGINDNGLVYDFDLENYLENYDSNIIISNSILEELDKQQLRIIRNSIYARHGYNFKSSDLQDYFSKFSWYSGTKVDVDNELTEIDKLNIQNIISYEKNIGNEETTSLVSIDSIFVVTQNGILFDDLSVIAEYLKTLSATQENPISLKLNISLGTMTDTESNWRRLLKILDDAGKYVSLDLSSCPMSGRDFNPISSVQTGKWFIVSLVLPDAAKNIPSGTVRASTFNYFDNLKILIANEIINIGLYVFNDCNDLIVSFPAINSIEENNFANCTGLVKIYFPKVTTISKGSFRGCTNLDSINFYNVINIDMSAFQDCTRLTNANLTTVINIGESAFQDCINLITVNFPVVETIGNNAFKGCTNLSIINIPIVKNINDGAFQNCYSLPRVNFPIVKTLGSNYYRSEGIFQNCTSLISASFPVAITIGTNTFQNCTSLTSLNFPLVTTIGENAFQYCGSLTTIYFPSASQIGKLAFADCINLASANFPEARTFMDDYFFGGSTAFKNCNNLISITIGEHYNYHQYSSGLPGDLYSKYREGGAGTYTRSIGSNSWTRK